jgi:hypothetical protein
MTYRVSIADIVWIRASYVPETPSSTQNVTLIGIVWDCQCSREACHALAGSIVRQLN